MFLIVIKNSNFILYEKLKNKKCDYKEVINYLNLLDTNKKFLIRTSAGRNIVAVLAFYIGWYLDGNYDNFRENNLKFLKSDYPADSTLKGKIGEKIDKFTKIYEFEFIKNPLQSIFNYIELTSPLLNISE